MPVLAQVEAVHVTSLESELMQHARVISIIYLVLLLLSLVAVGYLLVRWRRRPPPLRAALSRLASRPWSAHDIWIVGAVLAIGFACVFLLQKPWAALMAGWDISEESSALFLQSLFFHIAGLIAVSVCIVRRRRTWKEAFGISIARLPADYWNGAIALLATLPALLGVTALFHIVLNLLGHQPSLQDVALMIADESNPWVKIYFVVLAVGLAPMFEEILFRGLLLPVIARRYGAWAGLLVSSFFFASIHGHLPSFGTLFALSFALGSAYILTGSLTVAIAMHGLFNAITVTILLMVP